jgi:hypothetical protein
MSRLDVKARPPTFLELYARGEVSTEEIDDFIERWHEGKEPSAGLTSLHEFLGLTEEEYAGWVQDPASLPGILDARRFGSGAARERL